MEMDKILDVATRVSTPIAVAGLVIGVLLIIFYVILKKDIFPTLTRTFGGDLIKTMMLYLYRLALVSIILGFIAYLTPIILAAFIQNRSVGGAEFDIGDGWTLRTAITKIADGKGRRVRFNNCNDVVMSNKLKIGSVRGDDTTDLIYNLQHCLEKAANSKELYKIIPVGEGLYDVNCNN